MLQIDHLYEFLYREIFKDFDLYYLKHGYPNTVDASISDITIFTPYWGAANKILFYDQEPLLDHVTDRYIEIFNFPEGYSIEQLLELNSKKQIPYGIGEASATVIEYCQKDPDKIYAKNKVLATSEKSEWANKYNYTPLYYFFHGFAALDWYRGYHALNYSKNPNKNYAYDFISFNRIILGDRSYRIYWVSKLAELGLLDQGLVSFNVTDNQFDDWRDEVADPNTKLSEPARQHAEQYLTSIDKLVVDRAELPGSASASIPHTIEGFWPNNDQPDVDALWHVVTETVFYYNKLHLTEKIFKPIVSKQPFMLLAAPGNLEYLRSYGFKTFEGIIDESYDSIQDNDQRIDAVAAQLQWYCSLSAKEKSQVIERLAPIVEYNFQHFYGEFKHIITRELLDNCQTVFKAIGYDDQAIAYDNIYKVLTN